MIIFTDLHLNEDSADTVLGQVLPGILAAAIQHRQSNVVFLGDFWDIRYRVDVRLFNAVRDELHAWSRAGVTLRMLPGNHDQVDIQGRNALEAYGDIPGVTVYTEPQWDIDGFWLPYRKSNAELRGMLARAWETYGGKYPPVLFAHHGLSGAMMNDHYSNTDGLGLEEFTGWRRILCGHYHKRQAVGLLTYIGSPYQTSAGESGQAKGYALFDGLNLEMVDTLWGKRYHRFEVEPGAQPDLSDVREGDEVRVKVIGEGAEKRAELLGQTLAGTNAIVTPEVLPMQSRLEVTPNATLATYARAFVETVETPLDKGRLLKAFAFVTGAA